MEFKDINNILNESNALRRAYTAPLKNSYIIDLKAKPVKKIIVRNDAAKKLTTKWDKYRDPTDSLRKIMLDPTPKGYGGNGVYGVWEAVKGHEDLYADTTSENGIKWSFIAEASWLSSSPNLNHLYSIISSFGSNSTSISFSANIICISIVNDGSDNAGSRKFKISFNSSV